MRRTNWVEVYPDGSQSRYRLLGRETIDGQPGIVVVKTAGEAETTWTLNDGSFQAFLPDRDSTWRQPLAFFGVQPIAIIEAS